MVAARRRWWRQRSKAEWHIARAVLGSGCFERLVGQWLQLVLTRLVTLDCLPLHTTSGNAFSKSPSFGCSVWKLEWGALEEEDQEEARPLSSE